MEFTQWQIDKLRRGINAYRVLISRNGVLSSWGAVLQHVLQSDKTKHDPPLEGEEEGPFKQEALRRFANGSQNALEQDKLEDIWLFLIQKRLIGRDELEDLDDAGLMAEAFYAHRHYATSSPVAVLKQVAVIASYSGSRRLHKGYQHVELHFSRQKLEGLFLVEELTLWDTSATVTSSNEGKDARWRNGKRRKGYAFFVSESAVLHVHMRGAAIDDRIHYVRIGPEEGTALLLARTGDVDSDAASDGDRDALLQNYSVLRFNPPGPLKLRLKKGRPPPLVVQAKP